VPDSGNLIVVIVHDTESIDVKDAERVFVEFTFTNMTYVFLVIEEEEMQGNTDGEEKLKHSQIHS
jgi:hypothetical protein